MNLRYSGKIAGLLDHLKDLIEKENKLKELSHLDFVMKFDDYDGVILYKAGLN